jgi:competence protein ComEC
MHLLQKLGSQSGCAVISLVVMSVFTFSSGNVFASESILINELESNPNGDDSGAEEVELYNPSEVPVDLSGWSVGSTAGRTATVVIDSGATIPAQSHLIIGRSSQWLDNGDEGVELRDSSGALIDSAGPFSDEDNDDSTWQRSPDGGKRWIFATGTMEGANVGSIVSDPEPAPSGPTESDIEPALPADSMVEVTPEFLSSQNLTIVFIDVGQGDSILLLLPNAKTVLIDGGERQSSEQVLATLSEHNVSRIDVMVATHPHADHIGGLIDLINSNLSVGEVMDSGQLYTTQTFEDLLDAIDAKQIPLTSVKAGDLIDLDPSVQLEVLNPGDTLYEGEDEINNNSVVIKLTYGNFSALFTGDMEEHNEQRIINEQRLDVDVLKAGHHGSRFSSIDTFLQAVSPEVAVISAGENNTYGHPHQEALERIESAGVEHIFRTDLNGTITLVANGTDPYSIIAEKTGRTVVVPEFEVTLLAMSVALVAIVGYTRVGSAWKR